MKFRALDERKIVHELEEIKPVLEIREMSKWRFLLAANLPSTANIYKIQRNEAPIKRDIYQAIHEYKRLQATEMGNQPAKPVAVDLDINMEGEEGPN